MGQIYIRVSNHGGKTPEFAHVTMTIRHDGGKNPEFAHVTMSIRHDGGKRAESVHVNQTTVAKTHDPHTRIQALENSGQ